MQSRVVLIADRVSKHIPDEINGLGFEKLSDFYYINLVSALKSHYEVVDLQSPREFLKNIDEYKNDIVLSLWSGQKSRSRRALVPSICEAYDIQYVGADSYTQTICQDKHLTKSFLKEFNVKTPKGVLIKSIADLFLIKTLSFPLVVKPNFEGGSIGITSKNLKYNYEETVVFVTELLDKFTMPILIEEFVAGPEISIILFGNQENVKVMGVLELKIENFDPHKELYGLELKKEDDISKQRLSFEGIDKTTMGALKNAFLCLDKVEVLRVDGRINEGEFIVLELTPDISFEKDCYLSEAFRLQGYDYDAMINSIIKNTKNLEWENANN